MAGRLLRAGPVARLRTPCICAAIEVSPVSHAACRDEFRQNPRSQSSGIFLFMYLYVVLYMLLVCSCCCCTVCVRGSCCLCYSAFRCLVLVVVVVVVIWASFGKMVMEVRSSGSSQASTVFSLRDFSGGWSQSQGYT